MPIPCRRPLQLEAAGQVRVLVERDEVGVVALQRLRHEEGRPADHGGVGVGWTLSMKYSFQPRPQKLPVSTARS